MKVHEEYFLKIILKNLAKYGSREILNVTIKSVFPIV